MEFSEHASTERGCGEGLSIQHWNKGGKSGKPQKVEASVVPRAVEILDTHIVE